MTGTFKANNPYNNFLLFVYGLVLKFPMFLHPRIPQAQSSDGILYRALINWLSPPGPAFSFLFSIIAFALLYIQAISINKVLTDQRLFPKANYLAGMSYLLITSLFSEWNLLSAPLLINTLLIWILSKLCQLYNNQHAKTTLFNIGLATGLISLFYFPSIAFLLLIFMGIILTRPFRLQEWLILLIGVLTTYYFLASWFFLNNQWDKFQFPGVFVTLPRFHESAWAYTAIVFVLLLVGAGIVFIQNNMRRLLLQSRNSWNLIYLYLIVALFIPFLNGTHSFEYWILAAVPIACFAAAAFLFPERKWFALLFHWILVALSIIMGYF